MKKRFIPKLLLILTLALLANTLWLYEIIGVSSSWKKAVTTPQKDYSILIINTLAIFAYCFPIWTNEEVKNRFKNKILAFVGLYFCMFIGYYVLKVLFLGKMWPITLFLMSIFNPSLVLVFFLFLLFSIPLAFYWVSCHFIFPILKRQIIAFLLGILFMFFILTISNYRYYGFKKYVVNIIEMGFPFFWIVLIMGLIGMLTERRWLITEERKKTWKDEEDILDAESFHNN